LFIKGKSIYFAVRFKEESLSNSRSKEMSRICQITGKKALIGNHVSHSKRRVKRKFNVNLFNKKFYLPDEDRWVVLKVSAAGLRTINKVGIEGALKKAVESGYVANV
jgi:large subunit ribosomal protein L28